MIMFFKDVVEELKKLHTPTKKETYITVITILVVTLVSAIVIMMADFVISKLIKILFGLGV